jgi:excisionase family DNA binding protein
MEKQVESRTMSLMKEDEVLTTAEAIGYLKVSKPTFFKCIRQGRIKAIKVGNGWRVLKSELYHFLRGSNAPGGQ